MDDFVKVEGKEIVIRIPLWAIRGCATRIGVTVTDVDAFAPHLAREVGAEGMDEDLYLNKVFDAACIRAVEADAPGAHFDDEEP